MALTREQFLKRRPLPTETVTIPGLGEVIVRGLKGTERDRWEANLMPDRRSGKQKHANLRAKMVQLCVVDENGDQIFRTSDIDDLGQLPARDLQVIFDVATRLSGFDENEIEEAVKNSETTPKSDSGTS